jgi:thiamine-phosphate pyrophosphorylase
VSALAPRLIAITDTTRVAADELERRVAALCTAAAPGTVMVQLRDRELSARARQELGRRLLVHVRRAGQLFQVNDRVDLALALGADAVHLGEASIAPADARRLAPALWISRACHDPARAQANGADAVVLSPVLAPRKGRAALGLEALAVVHRAGASLVYALGGIDAPGARLCVEAGADGVAAIGAALAADPRMLLRALGIAR